MRLVSFLPFVAVACSACTVAQPPAHLPEYDCRLFAGPFPVAPTAGPVGAAFGQAREGVLLVEQYFNTESLNQTRFLDLQTHVLTVADKRGVSQQPLDSAQATQVERLYQEVERGAFRQVCLAGPSEGSRTLLLVKVQNDTIPRFAAPQYDYQHLNPAEREKLPRTLALIGLLKQPAN
jgi:hypothetical protein